MFIRTAGKQNANEKLIPFTDRLLFSKEELADCDLEEDEAYMKDWRMRVDACISLNGDPEEGIREVWCEYVVVLPEDENTSDHCAACSGKCSHVTGTCIDQPRQQTA